MRTRPQRERTRWDWKPLIVIPMMIYLNVGMQATGSSPGYVGLNNVNSPTLAVPAPINAAPGQTQVDAGERGRLQPPYGGKLPAQATGESRQAGYKSVSVAAPVQGVNAKGAAFVWERNPKYPLSEFTVMFTKERR